MEIIEIELPRGLSVSCRVWKPAESFANVVFLHGWGDHAGRYQEISEHLSRKGFACYAPDFEGHGFSKGERAKVHSFERLIDDLNAILNHAATGRKLFLHGHSMGVCLAAHYCLAHPDRISGVVFNSAALMVNKSISQVKKAACWVLGNYTPGLKVGYLKFSHHMTSVPEEIAAYENDTLIHHGKIDAGTGLALLKANQSFGEQMGTFKVPFLALQGTADELVNPDGPQKLYSLAPVADKTLKIFEGAKHDLLHERVKKEAIDTITGWLLARAKK